MRCLISFLVLTTVVFLPYQELVATNGVLLPSAPVITKLSKLSSAPFGIITITGSGFTDPADMFVTFSSGSYVANVPPVTATPTSLVVGVPFFLNTSTGVPGSGTVNVSVISQNTRSNSIPGFKIGNLPTTSATPGSISEQLLKDVQESLTLSISQLSFVKSATKGRINTGPTIARANVMKKQVTALLQKVSAARDATASSASIPRNLEASDTIPIEKLDRNSLALIDRIVLAELNALRSAVGSKSAVAGTEGEVVTTKKQNIINFVKSTSQIAQTHVTQTTAAAVLVIGSVVALAIAYPTATVVAGVALFLIVADKFVVVSQTLNKDCGILNRTLQQIKDDSGLYNRLPDWPAPCAVRGRPNTAATSCPPTFSGNVGGIIQTGLNQEKGTNQQFGRYMTQALDPQNTEDLKTAYNKANLTGRWAGTYSVSSPRGTPGGNLSGVFTQAAPSPSFSANISTPFGGGTVTGVLSGLAIMVTGLRTSVGCNIALSGGVEASYRRMSGTFSVTGGCLQPGVDIVTGTWNLSR